MKGSKDPSTWKSTTPSKDCNILPCLSLSQATSWLKITEKSQRTTAVGTSQTSSQAFPCAELGSMARHRLRLSHAYVCSAKPKNLPRFEYPQAFWPPRRQSHRQGLWQCFGFEASSRDGLEVGSRERNNPWKGLESPQHQKPVLNFPQPASMPNRERERESDRPGESSLYGRVNEMGFFLGS